MLVLDFIIYLFFQERFFSFFHILLVDTGLAFSVFIIWFCITLAQLYLFKKGNSISN